MKHVSGYEQHPSSEAECRPGWMFWVPPPEVGRRPGREPALQKERSNTGDTPCSHKADSLGGCWVVEAGGRGLQHVVPSARIARERSAGTKWRGVEPPGALKKRPALSGLAASVLTLKCSQPAFTTAFSAASCSLFDCFMFWCFDVCQSLPRCAESVTLWQRSGLAINSGSLGCRVLGKQRSSRAFAMMAFLFWHQILELEHLALARRRSDILQATFGL